MAEIKDESKPKSESTLNLVEELYFGTAEKTVHTSSYYAKSYDKPYPSDDLWQKTGDWSLYEEMKNDDQVHVALQLKKDLVIGSGWSLITEDSGDTAIADDISIRLKEDPDVAIDDQLEELIDAAYTYGFALTEKIFKTRDDNSLTINKLKTTHPDSWLIHTDDFGNVSKYEQRGAEKELDINPKSLIHYINNGRYQNPYGTSDLRACYNAWFTKRQIIKYYAIFLEKYSSPTPVARYDDNTPKAKVLELFNIIKKFQTKTAIAIPKKFEMDFLEAKSNGGDSYVKGIDLFNMFIGRSLLVPDLMGFQGSETSGGSFSLGKEQMEIFFKHIKRRRNSLERIINRHIIQPLVIFNHGHVENFPKFQFNPISDENALDFARTFLEAVKGRVYKPSEDEINHFRSLIKFPEGDVDEFEQSMPQFGQPVGEDKEKEDEMSKDEKKSLDDEKKKEFKAVFDKPEGGYSDKVDFKKISNQLAQSQDIIVSETNIVIDQIMQDLMDQVEKKKILLGKGKPERIKDLKIKRLSEMKKILKKNFRQHFVNNKVIARNELFKKNFAEPLPSDAFLALLEQETFDYVGDWEYRINQSLRLRLTNALKDGDSLSAVINDIDSELRQLGQVSVERYARTKLTEIMNRARIEEFEQSGAVQGYQYSAILDGRTTDICRGLHGKKFKKGTEPIPPMHFNCRSVLIPITIFEEFKPDTRVGRKSIDRFIDDNKGKGFSSR